MKIKCVREGEEYTHDEMISLFTNEGFKILLDYKVIKQNKEKIYKFKFVGVLTFHNICLIAYPKYLIFYDNDKFNNLKIFKQIFNVIRKYKSEQNKNNLDQSFEENDETTDENLLSIILELIDSYYEYGLYSSEKQIIEQNGDGEILWDKTINETTAYFSNNIPVYLDLYTVSQENNEKDYFQRLHAAILTEACNKAIEILDILDIEPINISLEIVEDFGEEDYINYNLDKELSIQFITYKQNILKLLKKYFVASKEQNNSNDMLLTGTTSFHMIWEKVCSVAMGDCKDKSIRELVLEYPDDSRSLLKIINKPKWKHEETGNKYESDKTLQPDIVVFNKDKRTLSIYDAKYYHIKLNEEGVAGQPGVGDITKQHLYELAYKKFIKKNKLDINQNAFLMPTASDKIIYSGEVTMNMFDYYTTDNEDNLFKFKRIKIYHLPAHEVYYLYLQNKKYDEEKLAIFE